MLPYVGSLVTLVEGELMRTLAIDGCAVLGKSSNTWICKSEQYLKGVKFVHLRCYLRTCTPASNEPQSDCTLCSVAWALATAGGMSQQQKLQTALQLAKGVQQLHGIRILHLDIKPQNVLVDQHGDVVLSDLGIAHQMQALSHYVPSSIDAIGTDNFM